MKTARKPRVRKFSSLMSKPLLEKLRKQADQNGQSVRFVIEKAVEHYLEVVVPSSQTVRPEVLAHLKASISQNEGLLKRLAKAK